LQLALSAKQEELKNLEERKKFVDKRLVDITKDAENIKYYNNLFSKQTYFNSDNKIIANVNKVETNIKDINDTIRELNNDPLKNKMELEIYEDKLKFNENLLKLKDNKTGRQINTFIRPDLDTNPPIMTANVHSLTLGYGEDKKIISGDVSYNGINFPYTIDATGADPDRGTTNLTFGAFPETDTYVTSGTYDHKTGVIDITWNVEVNPNKSISVSSNVIINATEFEIQRNNMNDNLSNNNLFNLYGPIQDSQTQEIYGVSSEIKDLKSEINKTQLGINLAFSSYEDQLRLSLLDSSSLLQRQQRATSEYINNRNK